MLSLLDLIVGKTLIYMEPYAGSQLILKCKIPQRIIDVSVTNTNIENKKDIINFLQTEQVTIAINSNKERELLSNLDIPKFAVDKIMLNLGPFEHHYSGLTLMKLNSERNIYNDNLKDEPELHPSGSGASNYIQVIQNNAHLNGEIINTEFLNRFNEIVEPEISIKKIISKRNKEKIWEVYFQNRRDEFIPISAMGSGIKTIFLVLVNLILVPEYESKNKDKYIFVFEELENNLHPSLQKRLYNYIRSYQLINKCQFFLTTHSSTLINFYKNYNNSQLIHIQNDSIHSNARVITDFKEKFDVLDDLGCNASDILQTNGIIWVEGPSDRIYISKWLKLLLPQYEIDIDYSIMFYGGKLLSNLSFTTEFIEGYLILVLKINRNAFVVIDSDKINPASNINKTKERVNDEVGIDCCWITKGKEIENYLKKGTINKWLKKAGKKSITASLKNTSNIGSLIQSESGINYNKDKSKWSRKIANHFTVKDLNIKDLKEQLGKIATSITQWNMNNYP